MYNIFIIIFIGGRLLSPDPATYDYSTTNQVIYNVKCPETVYSFYFCNYSISYDDQCTNHMNDYLLQCEATS